jgi:catechol 2,3-dioxygenase-like lactoylglutathione lyase family enzyme
VNLKARDDAAVGRFWAAALGWPARSVPGATSVAPAGFVWTEPDAAVCVDVIAVADPSAVRYRAHIELATASAAERSSLVARLTRLGATPLGAGVLADPEGNQFCVSQPRETYRDTGPIAAVVVDCADPRAMARFWSEAMGWTVHEVTDDQAILRSATDTGPCLEFHRTSHLGDTWHRAHLDVVPEPGHDQETEVARLRALGATAADTGRFPWVVLADPEGNEFCVLAPG